MADDAFQLPEKWRRGTEEVSLKLKCYPRGTPDCPRPYVVFVVIYGGGYTWAVSNRSFVKIGAYLALDNLLKMFHGSFTPRDLKGLRKRMRDRIRRYKCLPRIGGSGGAGRGIIGRSPWEPH